MLGNYLIGLREGLEASLIVGILVAYLVRTGNRRRLPALWMGVGVAIGLSLGFGALLTYGSGQLSFEAQEALGGTLSIIAVGFVTWMVFWMRRAGRNLKGDLHGKLAAALVGSGWALVLTAFLAVGREGLETALFIWSAVQATGSGSAPILGAALGIASAVILGYLIYRGALKLNLAVFFKWTGAALIVVAAGVLAYGLHDLQEAGILPGLNNLIWDVSDNVFLSTGFFATLVKAIFNFSAQTTWLQWYAWSLYLVTTLVIYFLVPVRPSRRRAIPAASPGTEQLAEADLVAGVRG
jgi:high-affinity iron transporter